ncbi:MAG: Ig-like domain-containing protein [Acidimicrobiales bacterium]
MTLRRYKERVGRRFKRTATIGASLVMMLGMLAGLAALATPASATTVTENFAGYVSLNNSWTELSLPQTITTPSSVTQGANYTMTVGGGTTVVPTNQGGVPVNYISGINNLIPIPSNASFPAGGTVSSQNWTYTSTSGAVTTGPLTVTYCTATGTGCTATAPSSTWLGPAWGDYLQAGTGSATFPAGGTLVLPSWSTSLTASGTGTIQTTNGEFITNANIDLAGSAFNVTLDTYPAVLEPTQPPASAPPYQFQPIASTVINSPPAPPVVKNQTASVSAGGCVPINVLNGATDVGDTINPATVVTTPATSTADGTLSTASTGVVTYCNTGGTAATDSFTFTVQNNAVSGFSNTPQTSNVGTVTINISYNTCSAGAGNASGGSTGSLSSCSLHQLIVLPVEPGQIILSQNGGLPLDVLGSSFCSGGTTPGIVLNGNSQAACGILSPLTVTNSTGLDSGWTLTGQVTDFNDPAAPGLTCDTTATYSNHCIPGGNLAWEPASAVAHNIVPGDTAQVASGSPIAPFVPIAPTASTNPILAGSPVQPNPVVEPAPNAGLHNAPQTLCSTASGQAGGTFICGAGLELVIPASIAEPGVLSAVGAPAYAATITLTLS